MRGRAARFALLLALGLMVYLLSRTWGTAQSPKADSSRPQAAELALEGDTVPSARNKPAATPGPIPENRPGWAPLSGRVVDENGAAVVDARVYVMPRRSYGLTPEELAKSSEVTQSDAAGRFGLRARITTPADLICRKAGYVPAFVPVGATSEPIDVVLRAGARLVGQVVDASGNPVPGATVRARAPSIHVAEGRRPEFGGRDALFVASVTAGDDGRFEISGLDEETRYLVEAWATGYALANPLYRTQQLWVRPSGQSITVRLIPIVAAVVGIRVGERDWSRLFACSVSARHLGVEYPPGYRLAYRGVPVTRLLPEVVARVQALTKTHLVLLAKPRDDQSSPEPGDGFITCGFLDAPPKRFKVTFRPIGVSGWDVPQLLRLEPATRGVGKVVVTCNTRRVGSGVLGLHSKEPVFGGVPAFAVLEAMNETTASAEVPPGRYTLMRAGTFAPTMEVNVAAGQTVRVTYESAPTRYLKVAPRYEAGAPARELALYVSRREPRRYVYQIFGLEACVAGPQYVPIGGRIKGELDVTVSKPGFEPVTERVTIPAEGDVTISPVLRPR